jgi:hypothetical protein
MTNLMNCFLNESTNAQQGVFCYAGWRINPDRHITIGFIMVDLSLQRQLKFIQHQHFFLSLITGLDVTQNISTAESPGRWLQCP